MRKEEVHFDLKDEIILRTFSERAETRWRLRNLGSLSVPVIKQKESFKENSSIRSRYVIKSAGKKKVLPSNH